MLDSIFDAIEEWMRTLLTNMVDSNLTTMFSDVNDKTGQIAAQVGQTPQGWNGGIYNMIQSLSNSVILPIAGIIIALVFAFSGTQDPARRNLARAQLLFWLLCIGLVIVYFVVLAIISFVSMRGGTVAVPRFYS